MSRFRDRELGGGEGEAEVGVGELAAEALARGEDDRFVVGGELVGGSGSGASACQRWEGRVGVGWDQAEVGGGELPVSGVSAGGAEGLELLEVGQCTDIDLVQEMSPDRPIPCGAC